MSRSSPIQFVTALLVKPILFCCVALGYMGSWAECRGQDGAGFRYIEIKVEDDQGKPVTKATLDIVTSDMEFPLPVDDQGIASFNLTFKENESGYLNLTVRADGYVAQQAWWRGKNIPQEFTFHLQEGIQIGGVIQDSSGKPISGVSVEGLLVSKETSASGVPTPYVNGELATTDDEGKWSAHSAPAGDFELRLKLSHAKYFSDRGFGQRRLSAKELKTLSHVEVLQDLIPPQGTVLDAKGIPASEAAIYLLDEDQTLSLENAVPSGDSEAKPLAMTDSAGKFELAPGEGEFLLLILADKGWSLVPSARFSKNKPIEVRLTQWAVAEGSLQDGGVPVADADLEITVMENDFYNGYAPAWWTYTTRTDAQGKYRCERMLAGPAIIGRSVEYSLPGDESLSQSATEANFTLQEGETTRIDIKRAGRTATGYVVGIQENGVDITPRCGLLRLEKQDIAKDIMQNIFYIWGQTLSINSEGIQSRTEPLQLGAEPSPLTFLAPIDSEGRFESSHIPPGDYEVSVSLERKMPGDAESQWFWGSADEKITIPEDSEGKHEAFDLGELEIDVFTDDEE